MARIFGIASAGGALKKCANLICRQQVRAGTGSRIAKKTMEQNTKSGGASHRDVTALKRWYFPIGDPPKFRVRGGSLKTEQQFHGEGISIKAA